MRPDFPLSKAREGSRQPLIHLETNIFHNLQLFISVIFFKKLFVVNLVNMSILVENYVILL